MSTVLIGIDLAKSVFQFHGLDAQGKVTLRKHVNRKDFLPFFERMPPGCHVAMEACGTAHHWGRRLQEMGHRVTLLPAHRVKAYVAPGKKNDANDAAAIAELGELLLDAPADLVVARIFSDAVAADVGLAGGAQCRRHLGRQLDLFARRGSQGRRHNEQHDASPQHHDYPFGSN